MKKFLAASFSEQLKTLEEGIIEILPRGGLEEKLNLSSRDKRPLRVKLGVDPTRPDLHLGHAIVLKKLKQFQNFGHQVILIIGDFTARVGDPSGRCQARPILSEEEIKKNAQTYFQQAKKILNPKKTEVRYNSQWLAKLSLKDLLGLMSTLSVAQLLEREDFRNRFKGGSEISLQEFLYPLMQGYDSVAVKADIEIGGSDQTFNLLVGREVQKFYQQQQQVTMTLPLLEGLDGEKKMSKSLGNYVGISEAPEKMFGKIMSLVDGLIIRYFRLCTDLAEKEVNGLEKDLKNSRINPRDLKLRLAWEIVKIYHGPEAAEKAQEFFVRTFSQKELPANLPLVVLKFEKTPLFKILPKFDPEIKSNSQAQSLVSAGGIDIDGQAINDPFYILDPTREHIIKIGKKKFFKIKFD
jgi:tyrosyl-tRNA synthetase